MQKFLTKTRDRRSRIVSSSNNSDDAIAGVATGLGFDGVVGYGKNGAIDCTGSLLGSGRHILTVAHCFDPGDNPADYQVQFDVPTGPEAIAVQTIFIHPGWTADFDNNNDIAILELAQTAPEAADRYDPYRDFDEVGQTFEKVGYGVGGNGFDGEDFGGPTGIRRGGKNRYDAPGEIFNDDPGSNIIPGSQLAYDFDSGSPANDAFGVEYGIPDLGLGPEEIAPGGGDSGSPAFIDGKVAGLTSFGQSPLTAGVDVTDRNDTSFGEFFSDTRVSVYVPWIEETIALSNGDDDRIFGNWQNNLLNGNGGNDAIAGLAGDDTLFGGRDDDRISGNAGADSLSGDGGDDTLFGGLGNDTLTGGNGADLLSGDSGRDLLFGGDGGDRFILSTADNIADPQQADIVADFTPDDRIEIEGTTRDRLLLEPFTLGGTAGTLIRDPVQNAILGFVAAPVPPELIYIS
jgi:Ca2+-binding RTX toxin-like protein